MSHLRAPRIDLPAQPQLHWHTVDSTHRCSPRWPSLQASTCRVVEGTTRASTINVCDARHLCFSSFFLNGSLATPPPIDCPQYPAQSLRSPSLSHALAFPFVFSFSLLSRVICTSHPVSPIKFECGAIAHVNSPGTFAIAHCRALQNQATAASTTATRRP